MKKQIVKTLYLKNVRKGVATNSSSTHSVIYKNDKKEIFKDLKIFDIDYYGRFDTVVAATKEAKIKYIVAQVYHNNKLMDLLEKRYPEIKQYYPLIKQEMEHKYDLEWREKFGMYPRSKFFPEKFTYESYDILSNIIEDENCVIVAGSDEEDEYDNITDNHDGIDCFYDTLSVIRNGNYYIIKNNYSKIRLCVEKEHFPVPRYPELIDINITDYCAHGCKCCYRGCTQKGKHADLAVLNTFVHNLMIPTEIVLGGGNVLDYPYLDSFLAVAPKQHTISMTIKASDCSRLSDLKNLHKIKGLGISVFNQDDAKNAISVSDKYQDMYVALHIIPEYLGYERTMSILNYISNIANEKDTYYNVVFLGYKTTGRGKECKHQTLTHDQLLELFMTDYITCSTDTCFNNTYRDFMLEEYDTRSLTFNEGEFSMYVDTVNKRIYRSSYELEKSYPLIPLKTRELFYSQHIENVFSKIRKDRSFPKYKVKNYWDKQVL